MDHNSVSFLGSSNCVGGFNFRLVGLGLLQLSVLGDRLLRHLRERHQRLQLRYERFDSQLPGCTIFRFLNALHGRILHPLERVLELFGSERASTILIQARK